ncbi:hypothetical protein FOMPIDRAFT_84920 [Fomitopsis schrenkii]|uniref:Glycopeptide n=1 Tax=Fomitopsis schrenkii TaxID=2126942 RepID=S8EDI1_FOMSC|nr:hypothetical protein FOMPIDRAFT_84920 [Fomitopsis schrenkii]
MVYNSWLFLNACIAGFSFVSVQAQEVHYVSFTNNCDKGTPVLGGPYGQFYTGGGSYEFSGPALGLISILSSRSYLQYTDEDGNDVCGENGEGCTMVEASLTNQGSNADITLIPPHVFSVTSGFGYYGGCDGAGADCTSEDCAPAIRNSSQVGLAVSCAAPNVSLAVTFCD